MVSGVIVKVGVSVEVIVGELVGVAVGVSVGVSVGDAVGVFVGVFVGVLVGVFVGIGPLSQGKPVAEMLSKTNKTTATAAHDYNGRKIEHVHISRNLAPNL